MPIILLRNGLRTRDLRWELLTNMTTSRNTFLMELDLAVHPHPPTRCSRSILFHKMFSAEPGMQSLPRKPTARPSMDGGNIGDNKESIFCRGGPTKLKTTICRNHLIYIKQAYSAEFHLKCKLAFHLECTNCQSRRECLASIQH
jgi:hypothetical protein